jgi:hypothetical protein
MLNSRDKAKAVIAALEEASPQLLADLATSGHLLKKLTDRVDAFDLQYARMMKDRDPREGVEVEESLMPMLTEFPQSKDQTALTLAQKKAVEDTLDRWEESLTSSTESSAVKESEVPNQPEDQRAILFFKDGFLTIDAKIESDGSFVFGSYYFSESLMKYNGRNDFEQFATVKPENKNRLLMALLLDRFGEDSSAFGKFKEYLKAKKIPYVYDDW